MTNVLVVGESWTSTATHVKGWDSFSSATFHTVTYTPRPIPLLVPDPAKGTYQNIVDATGQPFYFDGRPKFIYNPAALGPFGPKAVSGKTPTSSGVLTATNRTEFQAAFQKISLRTSSR